MRPCHDHGVMATEALTELGFYTLAGHSDSPRRQYYMDQAFLGPGYTKSEIEDFLR